MLMTEYDYDTDIAVQREEAFSEGAEQKAIEIATEAHKGQFDKSGNDYIGHPLRVMVDKGI